MTQKELYTFLLNNPLKVNVHVGSLEDLNGEDWIFLDFLTEDLIGSDDKGCYRTSLQITIATKDFENRKSLVRYVQGFLNVSVTYETSREFQYYLARCQSGVILNG